jgi:hypothetical protein
LNGCVKQNCYFATVDWSGSREDSSKMLSHFLRAWADSRKPNQRPAGVRGWGDPAGASAEETPRHAREPLATGTEINSLLNNFTLFRNHKIRR